jgi:hypothetical protein
VAIDNDGVLWLLPHVPCSLDSRTNKVRTLARYVEHSRFDAVNEIERCLDEAEERGARKENEAWRQEMCECNGQEQGLAQACGICHYASSRNRARMEEK